VSTEFCLLLTDDTAWFMFSHHLSAVTIIFIHSLHHPEQVDEFKHELRPSYDVFYNAAHSDQPFLVRAAGNGDKIIEAMFSVSAEIQLMML
jgi:hypothetical protein